MKKYLFYALAIALFTFTSCEKSEIENHLYDAGLIEGLAEASGENECFDFVYPLMVNMPDGSTQTIANKEGWEVIKKWDEKKGEEFSFQYPIDVIVDGATTTVNSEEEMDEVGKDCFGDDDKEDWGDDKEDDKEECFEIVLPVTVVLPDGTTQAVATKEDWTLVYSWYENHPDAKEEYSYQYPITVSFDDGAKILDIANVDELEKLEKECYGKDDEDGEKEDCFDFVYPVDYTMPDGSVIAMNAQEDWDAIKAWYEANPDSKEEMILVYPVDVVFEKDGSTKTIGNEDEMIALKKECD